MIQGLIRKPNFWLLILTFSLLACSQKPVPDGLWIGGAFELDKDFYQSLPLIWEFSSDSLRYYAFDSEESETHSWSYNGTTLTIDTFQYYGKGLKLEQNTLQLNRGLRQSYHRPKRVSGLPGASEVQAMLEGKYWTNRTDIIHFGSDKNLKVVPAEDSVYMQYCWEIIQFRDYQFLLRKGSPVSCEGYIQHPEQILRASPDELITYRWQDGQMQEVEYKPTPAPEKMRATAFQPCNPYLYINARWHRYYYKGTYYNGGIYTIKKITNQLYKPVNKAGENGLIRARFIVNCQGQAGAFEFLELDEHYEPKSFDPAISKQIKEITKGLQDWIAGKNDGGEAVDTYRILTYRLKDGQIVDIFP